MVIQLEEFIESATKTFHSEVALDASIMADRDLAGFFGDDNANGVRFFGESESGAVAQPEVAIQIFALTQGKNTGSGDESIPAHNDSAIMQDSLRLENCQDQFRRIMAVDFDARFGQLGQIDLTFQGNERTETLAREFENRVDDFLDDFAVLGSRGEPAGRRP